jgi:hypothetical protein
VNIYFAVVHMNKCIQWRLWDVISKWGLRTSFLAVCPLLGGILSSQTQGVLFTALQTKVDILCQRTLWTWCVKPSLVAHKRQSMHRANWELRIPKSTVQKVLNKWLNMKLYRIKLLQTLSEGNKQRRYDFCEQMLNNMDEDEDFWGNLSSEMKQCFT